MNWIPLALIIAFGYGSYNFLIKASADHIHQILGAVILQFVALLFGCCALGWLKSQGASITGNVEGIRYAMLAGVAVGTAEVLSFYFYAKGISASFGIPMIVGGTIVVGALLGIFILREQLTFIQWIGLGCIIFGITLLSTSPKFG
ncbi:EamA family transporter [filamentous cyanobacterium LEGE 11480]|uniref:EamA family transporter n=1 Tax=Romeriopsis navalis LEGE 11480 TaxID=2777977 RepID=A0A928VL86_9CYAN|nr:EamA family transporter [Romeriopsis navalis]MBE9030375.1 EamA family transporter [Romeriopsis navalis LEGE 11480]